MWESKVETLNDDRVQRVSIGSGGTRLTYAQVMHRWQHDVGFCEYFDSLLSAARYSAFFWETPPVTDATVDQPFEFVLVAGLQLVGVRPDPAAFESHFARDTGRSVVTFPNLGGDATLIAPCPVAAPSAYGHLAAFVREAPQSQRHTLWQVVGAALEQRIGGRPTWLSTSGLGVSWLHVRLDSRPKYYQYDPYRDAG
jgi:hypothetical protein